MPEKTKIIDRLGETALLLPGALNDALAANDRVKYFFTLLQAAVEHAERPDAPAADLSPERRVAGVEDATLDGIAEAAHKTGDGRYAIPQAGAVHAAIAHAIEDLIAPFDYADGREADPNQTFRARLAALLDALAAPIDDTVPAGYVASATHGDRDAGDSLHILVMDAHKALNRLQGIIAEEIIDGAKAYRIGDGDRALIGAFMAGVNRTAPLKFGHPGLGTTATRHGGRLLIQNDIGTTDAHVLVVAVADMTVTVTYTDIHRERLTFFENLFSSFPTDWHNATSQDVKGFEKSSYFTGTGIFTASNGEELAAYLSFLGSRLVYLIDWNKARKRLRYFVKNSDGIDILSWAATHDVGHRGFLVLGGEYLVFEAIEYAAGPDLHYGERLEDVLGSEPACEYLRFVLRAAALGLRQGRSERIIKDEIKAELLRYFQSAREGLLSVAIDHAAYVHELANAVRDGLLHVKQADARERLGRLAVRAQGWERKADDLTNRGRAMARHVKGPGPVPLLLEQADDAADDLEEAAFILTLVPDVDPADALIAPLFRLGDEVVDASRQFIRCLESAQSLHRGGAHEDTADFLSALDRVVAAEHAADRIVRDVVAALVRHSDDFRELHLVSSLSQSMESATDALAASAHVLRDYILEDVLNQ